MPQTAYLIDGMAYLFRSFFGMRPMYSPDGTPINAVFGLGMTLQKFINDHQPKILACCLDSGSQTFRKEIYPEYKANRSEPPEELIPQFDLCRDLLTNLGLATVAEPGFEADDLIATLTRRLLAAGHEVVIVTGDKDLAQLIEPRVKIYDLAKDDWWDESRVPLKWGVTARQVTDYLALAGDSADNIPGVKGVGPKAATALLARYPDLDSIYQNLDQLADLPIRGAKTLGQKLADSREMAMLSRKLVELEYNAPCDLEPESMRYQGASSGPLEQFAQQWGLTRVAAKIPRCD